MSPTDDLASRCEALAAEIDHKVRAERLHADARGMARLLRDFARELRRGTLEHPIAAGNRIAAAALAVFAEEMRR